MEEFENIPNIIVNHLSKNLVIKFDDIFLEGLKRKGHEFKNLLEAEMFVRKNCTCEDYEEREERVFFVNKIPFLFHNYKVHIHNPDLSSENFTITAEYGSYTFL